MAQRILIIGSPGSGKSTLARALGEKLGLPVVHLDQLYWSRGWIEADKALWAERLETALEGPAWVMEGNYGSTLEQRLRYVDQVVLLDLPPLLCTWRILARALRMRGRTRPDMAEGCPERINWEFFWYTLSFRLNALPRTLAKLEGFAGEVVWLGSRREVRAFLSGDRLGEDGHE